jgi:hypothetical protein
MYKKGDHGNPHGRPKGAYCGRIQALMVLDRMCNDPHNQDMLRDAMQADFEEDPMKFFRRIIVPLLPKSFDVTSGGLSVAGTTALTPDQIMLAMYRTVVPNAKPRLKLKGKIKRAKLRIKP